ncbi:vancomycin high temperature exclusion protein [bacterium]|nr:MAG: vancomycin high temperature exclusion protein [bacterium]
MYNRRVKRSWKRIVGGAIGLLGATLIFAWGTNRAVLSDTHGLIYKSVESVPSESVGLVLGTSPKFRGQRNLFFERRMDAAASLYRAGKVKKLLLSGDNGTRYYNEPTAMRKALIGRGIPEGDLVLDYAGFRTLDSVVRARTVFGVDRCTIVTDDFHLPRALYIAQQRGLEAVGFQTEPLPRSVSPRTYVREVGARSLVWIDLHVLNRKPKFSGPPEPIRFASR